MVFRGDLRELALNGPEAVDRLGMCVSHGVALLSVGVGRHPPPAARKGRPGDKPERAR
jgi:hypothetical protein